MNFTDNYFAKHTFLIPQIIEPPAGLLFFIVVIPVYLEEDIIRILESINNAELPLSYSEVIIVFNFSENDTEENKKICRVQYLSALDWSRRHSIAEREFFPLLAENLPAKHAGAGLARKIGMDEALHRFGILNKPEGLILSLDADTPVRRDYFTAIEKAMKANSDAGGCLIPFSHPLKGDEFSHDIYKAIVQYELHLRYYKQMLQFIGFPFAHYTIGSCFGVRAVVYARNGGMNRRKAGEDFYFLNKLFPHTLFADIPDTLVYPSPRPSARVPFGTGPVIHQLIQKPDSEFLTYNPESFHELKRLFDSVSSFYPFERINLDNICNGLHPVIQSFLNDQEFIDKLEEIALNTSSVTSFRKRFYLWFDGFRVVKYLNYAHKEYFHKIPVRRAVIEYFAKTQQKYYGDTEMELLQLFRNIDGIGLNQ